MATNDFIWDDESVKKFAEEYRFSSSRISIDMFKQSKIRESILNDEQPKQKPNRDWQVECFTDGVRNWERQKNGLYTNYPFDSGLTEEFCIEINKTIHKVKRLSDREVFTIGDEVNSTWGNKIITGFVIDDYNEMVVEIGTWHNPLKEISKQLTHVPPQSGEFITKEECERRERLAFENRNNKWTWGQRNGELKYPTFEDYKQSIKQ